MTTQKQKYSLEPEAAILGNNGLAIKAGWLTIYHAEPYSREFIGARPEYLMEGVGLPANSYPDAPKLPDSDDMAVCRSEDKSCWQIVPDYRGKTAYNKQTRAQYEITALGELPEFLTFKQPATDFDKWDGKKWVIDKAAVKDNQIEQAEQWRVTLLQQANETVALLQHAVDTELASEKEKLLLLDWKKYFVLMNRINISSAPDIHWPEKPE
ncbi:MULTISPECIES: tail fiber assembly protein [unclassified Photorhabdus]|uniref:tail fiber assembly protein n=1 Tax=unclassified Photorhabdus TaxID=2620880 RepID=UPI000DCF24E6|nr:MULTISPECIES: tail fiber assembly protein [unclassified Photorhabdus]RAW91800.1 phage tail protein [Photorhabdus sp. S10-54]RAW95455.1 phage tail protein [Photorhabdus sp. S8-52]RAW95957.1 phage tail protein [Photorhabdus sp. S9-53]